jgi:hypothetical protein
LEYSPNTTHSVTVTPSGSVKGVKELSVIKLMKKGLNIAAITQSVQAYRLATGLKIGIRLPKWSENFLSSKWPDGLRLSGALSKGLKWLQLEAN